MASSLEQVSDNLAHVAERLTLDVKTLQLALMQTADKTRLSEAICLHLIARILTPADQSSWQSQAQLALLELEWSTLNEPEGELITLQQALYQHLSHSGALQP
ncbi:MAG: hypothetical protein IGS03_12185 [Candidatus Sericytochromatia bacterium]|nr:hypothetical protein [Candidatus Sericytochromatia bacterium]